MDKNEQKNEQLKLFVKGVIEHANFKNEAILTSLNDVWTNLYGAKLTASFYVGEILNYYKYKTRKSLLSQKYKAIVDDVRNSVKEIVCTDEKQMRQFRKSHKYKKLIEVSTQPMTERFVYGIRFNGCCMITFNSEREQEMFVKGLEMASIIKDYKKIHIKTRCNYRS